MKKLKNSKEQELISQFKEKLSLTAFKEKQKNLSDYLKTIPPKEKRRGGDGEQAYAEICTLLKLGINYKASYLKWTGDQQEGNDFDGVLYFGSDEQKIEISALMNPEEMQDYRGKGRHREVPKSIVQSMKQINFSEDDLRKYWKSNKNFEKSYLKYPTITVEDFIYDRLISIFKKKNKEKYKKFWLVISYSPRFSLEYFNCDEIKKYVFEKIKKEDKFYQVKNIFNKVVFVPYDKGNGHNVFELDESYF